MASQIIDQSEKEDHTEDGATAYLNNACHEEVVITEAEVVEAERH